MYFGQREIATFIPQLSVFAVAAFRILPSVGKINENFSNILYSAPSLDLIYHDLKDIEELPKTDGEQNGAWTLDRNVELKHVAYRYDDSEEVLSDVSFDIPKGKTVALIGSSGAGKTTLADMVLGLLVPERGRIEADGMDIHRNLATWQKEVGYIPQTTYLRSVVRSAD